jgi:hypothetical protein
MRRNGGPVVAIDIDGTLGDYHSHFLAFAAAWYGRAMPDPSEINPGLPLYRFMKTSKSTYRACKLAYRQGGMKRSMPCYPGARELTVDLRRAGAEVWICTTRPYLSMANIEPDTRHWLKRHGIQYDGVLFGPNKYRDLVKQVGSARVAGVLEDLERMVVQAKELGLYTVLREQPYNTHVNYTDSARTLHAAEVHLLAAVIQWKEDHA